MRIHNRSIDYWVNHDPYRRQRLLCWLTRRLGIRLFGLRSYGEAVVPTSGPFIIAPNHGSKFDGFFFGHRRTTTVRFMTGHRMFRKFFWGRLFRFFGGFPLQRKVPGQPALEISRRVLEKGQTIIMFMEGEFVRELDLAEPRRGLAVLALQTGVPVVPAGCYGNKPAFVYGRRRTPWGTRTTVVWGEPMQFERVDQPSDERVIEVRDAIWSEVTRLHGIARELHERTGGRPESFAVPPRHASVDSRDPVGVDG